MLIQEHVTLGKIRFCLLNLGDASALIDVIMDYFTSRNEGSDEVTKKKKRKKKNTSNVCMMFSVCNTVCVCVCVCVCV